MTLLLLPATAFADAADAGSEATTLVAQIDKELALTTSADCANACRALESMRRAADRLCAIEPGDRCEESRAKVRDAAERVRASCPACESATTPPSAATPPPTTPQARSTGEDVRIASAQSSKRGGCAGCAVTVNDAAPRDALAAFALAALAVTRRARRRKRDASKR